MVDGLLDRLPGQGAALLIRGAPGIGKSTLLAEARRRAAERGALVLRTSGVESEARLPFAGLHQLLRPVLGHAESLAPPQRDALLAAFGMAEAAAPPDPFLIALSVLNLLSDTGDDVPVLLSVEDAHWLDRPTLAALAFVARRLDVEPIVLVAAARDGVERGIDIAGVRELRLEGLDDDASRALLDETAPGLAATLRERFLAEAAGNPLALVELPLAAGHVADSAPLPAWLPLTTRLEQAFAAQVSALPTATRTLLLAAAHNDGDALSEVIQAGSRLAGEPLGTDDLAAALQARLVEVEDLRMRFRHPLVRSAIHQSATLAQRHAAHAALAESLVGEPGRRVWHRAAALIGADEEVAADLDEAATVARRRGASTVAFAALQRAAQVSEDPACRTERLVRAAELAFELGRPDTVLTLLREAEPLTLTPPQRTRLAWLREMSAQTEWSGDSQATAFVAIAEQLHEVGDTDLALNALFLIAFRSWWTNPNVETRELIIRTAEAMLVDEQRPERLAVVGLADPVGRGAAVLECATRLSPESIGDPLVLMQLASGITAVTDYPAAQRLLATAVEGLRAQGRLGLLAHGLTSLAWGAIHMSAYAVAMPAAEEAARLARETAQPRWAAVADMAQATIAGLRGDGAAAERFAEQAEGVLLPMGAGPMLGLVQYGRGVAALAAGRHAEAFASLRRIFDPDDIAHHQRLTWWAIGDIVDAGTHCGEHAAADALVAELDPIAAETPAPLLHAGLTHARALLADDHEAEGLFEAGVGADSEVARWPLLRARMLLNYGAWLRRQRRVADSRAPLRAAREAFDALGAIPWAERARQELRASGETSRRRTPDARDALTPQELQIAQMAAAGMTNREIGQQLYLSHRTVGSHLYRIFPKLGITSRSELPSALPSAERAVAVT